MRNRSPFALIRLAACLLLAAGFACGAEGADAAAQANDTGTSLLRTGDLDGALEAFGTAVKKDGANETYRMNYAILRQVLKVLTWI